MPATIASTPFGTTPAGDAITLFTLRGPRGHEAALCNHGGILVRYLAPDRAGRPGDIVLGYDHLADYLRYNPFFGCLVGRYANRIAGAAFTLNGRTHRLELIPSGCSQSRYFLASSASFFCHQP